MRSTIHELARTGGSEGLSHARKSGANLDEVDEFGATALHYAVASKNRAAVRWLLAESADVTIRDCQGKTALHAAIEYGMLDVAAAIIEKNADIVHIADDHGNQPLWTAAFNARGRYEFVDLLISAGADVNHVNRHGLSVFDVAERMGDETLRERLVGGR